MNALETTGLGERCGRTHALRDCTLAVPTGSITALVGPNGAGKTTLLHLAVGVLKPTSGQVRIAGRPLRQASQELARVGFVAQDKPLFGGFTVADDAIRRRHKPSVRRRLGMCTAGRVPHDAGPEGPASFRRATGARRTCTRSE